MNRRNRIPFVVLATAIAWPGTGAARDAIVHGVYGDSRVQRVVYDPHRVVPIVGTFGYVLAIEFSPKEKVQQASVGDAVAWQIVAKGNRVFLKPQEEHPETNLIVFTDRRAYQFSLRGVRASGPEDPRITYRVAFSYPDDDMLQTAVSNEPQQAGTVQAPPAPPSAWNWRYSYKGSAKAAPLQVLDDGTYTYFRFEKHESLPAIFAVDDEKKETLVNARREGDWYVVERIGRQYTLRANNNQDVTCVFNDGFPARSRSTVAMRAD
jgi:type IV secretion system protein VirB9